MIPNVIITIVTWAYAVRYGIWSLFDVMKMVVTEGYGNVFKKIKRERPACLQDPNLGTHGFLKLEDVKIHYVAKGPEDKPLMLFVHGFPDFWYSWRKQLIEFSKDYRCVAIDMRGYGDSDKPSGIENYKISILMKDLQQVIEALGYKSCVLVAHDWGGVIGWSFGRHYPDYVDKLIIMNCPASSILEKLLYTDKKQFKSSWYVFFFQLPYLPEFWLSLKDYNFFDKFGQTLPEGYMQNVMTHEVIEAYKYNFSQPGAFTPPINFYRAALRYKPLPYDMNYTMPVLLIWGMCDIACSDKIPDLTEQANSKIVVKRIEKSGHFVQCDFPEETNKIMREWLSSS